MAMQMAMELDDTQNKETAEAKLIPVVFDMVPRDFPGLHLVCKDIKGQPEGYVFDSRSGKRLPFNEEVRKACSMILKSWKGDVSAFTCFFYVSSYKYYRGEIRVHYRLKDGGCLVRDQHADVGSCSK